jgi:hypothetical protein
MADHVDGRTQHRLPGVEPGLLHGSPREGGFGLQPVTKHVHACHAMWLCRTLRALLQATADISRDPAEIILPDSADLPGGVDPPRQRSDPMWLPLVATAFPSVQPLHAPPVNPPLRCLLHAHRLGPWLAHRCGGPGLPPAMRLLATIWGRSRSKVRKPRRSPAQPGCSPFLAPLQLSVSCAAGLSRPEPRLGRTQRGKATGSLRTPQRQGASRAAVGRYSRSPVAHSIRAAGHHWTSPRWCQPPHCYSAFPNVPSPHLEYTLDNRYKEALLRLAVNSVPGAGGYGIVFLSAYLCGWLPPSHAAMQLRHHAFWICHVACAVCQQLNQALPPGRPCAEPNFWLVQAPPGAQQPVWDVVAPAALSAMDVGRRPMWFRHFRATTPPLLDIQQCVQAGCTRATSAFWLSLHSFARVCRHLPLKGVGVAHPFLYVSGQPPRLCLRLPL